MAQIADKGGLGAEICPHKWEPLLDAIQQVKTEAKLQKYFPGILLDKDNVINYHLVISYRLLIRILTNQPTVDKTSVFSTNC